MTTISSSSSPSLVTSVRGTEPRQTPSPAGRQFRDALESAATGLLVGIEKVSPIPGTSVVTAAIRPGESLGATPEAPAPGDLDSGVSLDGALGGGTDQAMALLELQQRMSVEQRQYMALSNAMKARHDTAKNVLGNVR